MGRVVLGLLFGFFTAFPAAAQMGQQAPPKDPLAAWLRNAYATNRNFLVKSAEKFPEESYGMRPGPQQEVRTFGQIIGHLANYNYMWCSQAKGEKDPSDGKDFSTLPSKAALVKALNGALAYCDAVYAGLTDASGMEILRLTREDGRQVRVPRISLLILNYGHNNEHYGNLVTYMRIKSIVPPSSEPRR